MSCDFCENNLIDRTIFCDEVTMAFLTITPIVPGHVLVCPVRHIAKIDELTGNEWDALRKTIEKMKVVLQKARGATGFNIAWNEGKDAGQSVPHLHVHIVPRQPGDAGIYEYEPRKFLYRPGSRAESSSAELADLARLLRYNK